MDFLKLEDLEGYINLACIKNGFGRHFSLG